MHEWRRKSAGKEISNTTRIHTELFGLPGYSQAGLGRGSLRERVREEEGRRRKGGIFWGYFNKREYGASW